MGVGERGRCELVCMTSPQHLFTGVKRSGRGGGGGRVMLYCLFATLIAKKTFYSPRGTSTDEDFQKYSRLPATVYVS